MKGVKRTDGKKAHTEASIKYNKKAYDSIFVRVKTGDREKIQAYCAANNVSVNNFIVNLIRQYVDIEELDSPSGDIAQN